MQAGELVENSAARQATICDGILAKPPVPGPSERLPLLSAQEMTPAQVAAARSIKAGPRGCLFGPFAVLQRSPELLERAQQLGAYLRFRSVVPERLREMTILMVGKYWRSPYIWYVHEPIARASGVTREMADAIASGRRPEGMSADEQLVYNSISQLLDAKTINDRNYGALRDRLTDQGVVEITALVGYFSMLALTLNVARTPVPDDYPVRFADADASVPD